MRKIFILLPAVLVLLVSGCKQNGESAASTNHSYALFNGGNKAKLKPLANADVKEIPTPIRMTPELDFEIKNATGKTIFATCFSYIQKESFVRWRWDKSAVYKLEPGQNGFVNIDTIPDDTHREHVFGYLTVFDDETKAHDAIYELVDDRNKIDLDKIYDLKGKIVVIDVKKYGFKKEKLDFDIVDKLKKKRPEPELDFFVENRTGKTIYVTSFTHQVKDNVRMVWGYDKSAVLKLEPGQSSVIDIDTITNKRDRQYMSGYLAVFDEHEEKKAHESTYELLEPRKRLSLGRLSRLKDKKVVIDIEQYGAVGEITEFDLQPTSRLFAKSTNGERVAHMIKKKEKTHDTNKKPLPKKKNKGNYQLFD